MPKKLKVLVSAYACSPYHGSEPGMGWNFVKTISQQHEVHVISEKRKWEKPVNDYLNLHPELKDKIQFYFIDKKRNKWLRKIWPPSYYWFYRQWQRKVFALAKRLDEKENFDVIHQLNMVGYREPGYLWKIEKPFVWGPIGGLENSPWSFLPSLGLKGFVFFAGRNIINAWQHNFLSRPKQAASRPNSRLISATPDNAAFIKKLWGAESVIIPEVGQEKSLDIIPCKREGDEPLRIVWSGLHIPRKNLKLLLSSLNGVTFNYELHILGHGEMNRKWRKFSEKLKVEKYCRWHGWLEKEKAINVMSRGHVFCITSISDLTSSVTLEALSFGLPIICLDHCGFAHVVNASCGIKVPVTTPKAAAKGFQDALQLLYSDESYRRQLSEGALKRAAGFSWQKKGEMINEIYQSFYQNPINK